jgi:hypothetical protein
MKKKSLTTKPSYITQAGTLYHIINSIIQKKECYMENRNSHDKEDQDTSNMKSLIQAIQTEPVANLTLNLFKGGLQFFNAVVTTSNLIKNNNKQYMQSSGMIPPNASPKASSTTSLLC